MEDIYLTLESKAKYMRDFNENVLKSENESWKLDQGLPEILTAINQNPNIQTLYSQRYYIGKKFHDYTSYIKFAYTGDVEHKLLQEIVPNLISKYSDDNKEMKCNFEFENPKVSEDDDNNVIGLDCYNDGNYFNINRINIIFNSYSSKDHDDFWNEINTILSNI